MSKANKTEELEFGNLLTTNDVKVLRLLSLEVSMAMTHLTSNGFVDPRDFRLTEKGERALLWRGSRHDS